MDKLILKTDNVTLWILSKENLPQLAAFIVDQNYRNNKGQSVDREMLDKEYETILQEEVLFFEHSLIIAARDSNGAIIGSIRVMNWSNSSQPIPLTKIFGEHLINKTELQKKYGYIWHIGRFAVNKKCNCKRLFILLILYAITPMFKYAKGVLLAEVDERLSIVLQMMKINLMPLSESKVYIGSRTIPMMVTKEGLCEFMLDHTAMFHRFKQANCYTAQYRDLEYV
jgi:hypothetical protein